METGRNDQRVGLKSKPLYWFALIEQAVKDGELELAAEAVRELKRLGISVRYRCRPLARKEVRE